LGRAALTQGQGPLMGVAFVEMESEQAARQAVGCLDGFPWSVHRVLQVRVCVCCVCVCE
jgi:hypothetical protein